MSFPSPGRAVLGLAALDCCATALWLLACPAGLLHFLGTASTADALLLLRLLGALLLAQAACLALAVRYSKELMLLPLLSRALQVGLELWLLASARAALSPGPLGLLLGHDVVWLLALLMVLAGRRNGA
jgi:hypothetical protein